MILYVIIVLFIQVVASAPQQIYLSPEDPYRYDYPYYSSPRGLSSPSFFQQLNPFNSWGQPLEKSLPPPILLIDARVLALYDIIKCLQMEGGDITKCQPTLDKCDGLFTKKKKKPQDDDDDEDDDDDDYEDKRRKNKKQKNKKSKNAEDTTEK